MGFLIYIVAFVGTLLLWGKKNNIPIKNKGVVYLGRKTGEGSWSTILNQRVIGGFWSGKTLDKSSVIESLSIEELKYIANNYEKLERENSELIHFKKVALNHITRVQLEAIEEEIEYASEKY